MVNDARLAARAKKAPRRRALSPLDSGDSDTASVVTLDRVPSEIASESEVSTGLPVEFTTSSFLFCLAWPFTGSG